jgi:hypothetical protein
MNHRQTVAALDRLPTSAEVHERCRWLPSWR